MEFLDDGLQLCWPWVTSAPTPKRSRRFSLSRWRTTTGRNQRTSLRETSSRFVRTERTICKQPCEWDRVCSHQRLYGQHQRAGCVRHRLPQRAGHPQRKQSRYPSSEPNYIWAEAGTNFGVLNDNDPYTGGTNQNTPLHLSNFLSQAGKTWKSYQEDIDPARNDAGQLINTTTLRNITPCSSSPTRTVETTRPRLTGCLSNTRRCSFVERSGE